MSVADASFEEAWDIAKAHPLESRALRALEEGTSSPGYISVMGNKGGPMHQALNRYMYGKSALRPGGTSVNRRLIEPFMGGMDVAFAIRPDEGMFGNDYDILLPMIAEQIRDNPEKVSFDPRKLLSFPGDELSIYPQPKRMGIGGDFDPIMTLPAIRESDFSAIPDELIYDGGAYLPLKYYQLRADVNRQLAKLRAGELSESGKQQLAGDALGLGRAMYNSILRYSPKSGAINSAMGAKEAGKRNAILGDLGRRMVDYIEDETGKRKIQGIALDSSAALKPQSMRQISTDLEGNPDISPYDLNAWSDMMDNFHFVTGDYRDFLDDLSLRPDTGFYGDFLVPDPPYGEETGQHSQWTKDDTMDIYRRIREYGDQGIPVAAYNDASPTTIEAIRAYGLPLSMILARQDRGSPANQKKKPESLVTQNIPGLTGVDFYPKFLRDVVEPEGGMEVIPDWMFDTGKAKRLEEDELTTTIDDPATGRRSWMETDPARVARILSQPRYRRKVA